MALEWDKSWKKAKQFFKDETGKRKPDAKVDSVFMKHQSGLEAQITAVMKAHVAASKLKTDKSLNDYRTAVNTFKTGKDNYLKVLETAVEKEIKEKETKTAYYRACKFLAKELTSIHTSMEGQVGWLISAQKAESATNATATNAISSIQGGIAKCLAAAAKVKTKPEPKVFRDTIYTPARDLSQYIGNIPRLRQKGFAFPDKLKDNDLKALYEVIRPYGDGDLSKKVPDTASAEQVILELKKFVLAVKSTDTLMKS